MEITSKMVKELRDKTSAGMMDCKKALIETAGDMEKAVDFLRLKGVAVAEKRAGRATSEGYVETYIHAGGKLGVMVEIGCETDFVAKSDMFQEFAKDVAMQIAAMSPVAVGEEDVPAEVIAKEKEIGREKALQEGKPENIVDRIAEGMVKKFLKENTLSNQDFTKDSKKTVGQYIKESDKELQVTGVKRFAVK